VFFLHIKTQKNGQKKLIWAAAAISLSPTHRNSIKMTTFQYDFVFAFCKRVMMNESPLEQGVYDGIRDERENYNQLRLIIILGLKWRLKMPEEVGQQLMNLIDIRKLVNDIRAEYERDDDGDDMSINSEDDDPINI
jgi:hypothetical protein